MAGKDIKITIPYSLAEKLNKKIKKIGFNTIDEYVAFVLEQAISSEESGNQEGYDEEEEKNVKESLKELGYL